MHDRPIAKRTVLSGDTLGERGETEPFGPVKADPSRLGDPMVPHISTVGCLRTGPCEANLGLSGLATLPLSESSAGFSVGGVEGDQRKEVHREGFGATGGPWRLY